ncbi:MAG TPA: Gfo/Idh/MocA family oxidoreductase [Vicinamibacterales bacterium]|jgi:scyllo-inositol 2-dehydrogenase (NAD+)|nr:Gfo/Idh/MocA family oxidoreductase [Vicinamibacterales bacterium]
MKQINVGIIGTGWCGGIRAVASASSPWVKELHIAETREERLKEVAAQTHPVTATSDYRRIIENPSIDAVMISTTPEGTHYPFAKEAMLAGKHVFLEKPIAIELAEADDLIHLSRERNLRFTIGYSQRFNPKFAYVKRSLEDGTIGEPVSALVSRHITRNLGKKISGRVKLSPAAMESTHDLDFVLWCLEPRKPIRVYAQEVWKIMKAQYNAPDCVWMIVTMDDGTVFTVGGGWVLPPAYPNFASTWIEFVGTEGALMVDDTHRDVYVSNMKNGIQFPMSTMPGEKVNHVYAGPMEAETLHFLECVATGKAPLVTAEQARMVMQLYKAADESVETNRPVDLRIADVPTLATTSA